MNWNRLLTAVVAACCLVAVGTAATTMDSSVSTEPEEAVEFDHLPLPTGAQDSVGQLRRQVSTDAPGGGTGAGAGGTGAGGSGSSSDGAGVSGDGGSEQQASNAEAADGGDPRSVSGSQSDRRGSRSEGGADGGPREAAESLLERLLDFLRSLLALLPALVALLALAGAAYLLRDRLPGLGRGDADGRAESGTALGDPAPQNDVSRAWYEMVERVGLADRYDLTPDEHAERAAERGVDPEAAATLTRLFEEVRYGDAPVTDERRRRARERVQEIRAQARSLRAERGGGSER